MRQLGYPTSAEEMRDRLAAILAQPDYQTLVAEVDGRVAGMAGICVGYFYEQNGRYGRILALVVDEGCRGRGVGSALVLAAERWAAAQGAHNVVLNSGRSRTAAHRFYTRLGYEATGLRFIKTLG